MSARRAVSIAVALLVATAACGPTDAPLDAPLPASEESPSATPTEPPQPAADEDSGSPLVLAQTELRRRPTPIGPWEGHGLAWLEKLGGSPRDYPGPASAIGPAAAAFVPDVEWVADPSSIRCDAPSGAPQGVAVSLDLGSCAPEDCVAAVQQGVLRGVGLHLFEGSTPAKWKLAAQLAGGLAEATATSAALYHAAVPAPPSLAGPALWEGALEGELLAWTAPTADMAPHRLLLLNLVARGLGRRGLLAAPGRAGEGSLARLGLHLATGGATMLDSTAPPAIREAVGYAQRHRELFMRYRAPVALVIPVDQLVGGDAAALALDRKLVGIARLMTEAGFALEPVLVGSSPLLPIRFQPERLARSALVVVPGGVSLDASVWSQLEEGAQGAPFLLIDDVDLHPPSLQGLASSLVVRSPGPAGTLEEVAAGRGDDVVARWRRQLDNEDERLIDTARRSDGAVDGGNLPPRVLALPTWSPETGQAVQHLINLEAIAGAQPLVLEQGVRVELPLNLAAQFERCVALLHLPGEGRAVEGECSTRAASPSVWATFADQRSLPGWSAVEVRLLGREREAAHGVEPILVHGSTGTWSSPTVGFEVPFLDDRQVFSLSLPEFVRVEDAPPGFEGDIAGWSTSAVIAEDRRSGRFLAESPTASFEAELTTGLDRVDITITLENRSDRTLRSVEALLCASSRGASPFPESGHGRTTIETPQGPNRLDSRPVDGGDPLYLYRRDLSSPGVSMRSVDDAWEFGHAFDGSVAVGGNGSSNGVCLHSRPHFGDLQPGQRARRAGLLYLGRAGGFDVPEGWHPAEPEVLAPPPAERPPCAAPPEAPSR